MVLPSTVWNLYKPGKLQPKPSIPPYIFFSYHLRTILLLPSYVTYQEACFSAIVNLASLQFLYDKGMKNWEVREPATRFVTDSVSFHKLFLYLRLLELWTDSTHSLTHCAPRWKLANNRVTVSRCCLLGQQSQKKLLKTRLLHWGWRCKFWIDYAVSLKFQ